ncbi:MAG: hypothetical protein WCU88_01395 [Elusimicrobiota bacterium]|jgi:hypothetical protein
MSEKMPEKKKVRLVEDLQCGTCGALTRREEQVPKFCSSCGAGYERYCIRCRKKVGMYFEEWWPEDDECVRTYAPARRCPHCNAGLDVEERQGSPDVRYDH